MQQVSDTLVAHSTTFNHPAYWNVGTVTVMGCKQLLSPPSNHRVPDRKRALMPFCFLPLAYQMLKHPEMVALAIFATGVIVAAVETSVAIDDTQRWVADAIETGRR